MSFFAVFAHNKRFTSIIMMSHKEANSNFVNIF